MCDNHIIDQMQIICFDRFPRLFIKMPLYQDIVRLVDVPCGREQNYE